MPPSTEALPGGASRAQVQLLSDEHEGRRVGPENSGGPQIACRCSKDRFIPITRQVTHFESVPPRLARNTIIESTFEIVRRFSLHKRVEPGQT
jgi:hypothetical protein